MSVECLYVMDPGLGCHLQDRGRPGLRRFGVPASGPMDAHASAWANQLLDNEPGTPVLELLLQGAKLAALRPLWVAVTGADASANVPLWRVIHLETDDVLTFGKNISGVWTYVAVEGGFVETPVLGSVSASPRVRLGRSFTRGSILSCSGTSRFELPKGVGGRLAPLSERRNYTQPPSLRLWPGPQWDQFPAAAREAFLAQSWSISARSDRTGYRLEGKPVPPPPQQIISEPVLVGSVQIPPDGQPIVTLNDGPTIGGYPKIGLIDPDDLSWFTQCRPGQKNKFHLA